VLDLEDGAIGSKVDGHVYVRKEQCSLLLILTLS